jgi:hypothetical protein
MSKKLIYMLLFMGMLALPAFAIAGPLYIAGGVSSVSLDFHKHDNCRTIGGKAILGWTLLKNVAAEIHYTEGNGKEDEINFEIRTISGFAKINLFTTCGLKDKEKAQLYALLGATQLEVRFPNKIPDSLVEGETLRRTEKVSGFSYGAGFSAPISKRTNFRIEFNHLINDGFWDASLLTALVSVKF